MVYQGSKNRLAKYIVPILQNYIDKYSIITYIEPMVGGANVIDKIRCKNKIGSDINDELISLFNYIQSDTEISIAPDNCTFEHYSDVRENRKNNGDKYSKEYTALIGYCASYGGRYFDGGYGRDSKGGRSIYNERVKNLKDQAFNLSDIEFRCCDYHHYKDIQGGLIYFDPPYKNTKQYSKQSIDYDEFYDFCRELSKKNIVVVSEYNMPEDFVCIWEKDRKVLQKSDRKSGEIATEKLFVHKDSQILQKGKEFMSKTIKIKYFTDRIEKIVKIDEGDWIDLRAAKETVLKAGEFALIPLGVAMELPEGYEAHVVPRSSTFKNFGIIQTNHQGVIDESYCGNNDQWFFPAYALRDTVIHVNDRICQFRIVEKQPELQFEEVEVLDNEDRGGHGSTGKQ